MKRLVFVLILLSQIALAGGPLHVAGISGFHPGLAGTAIKWADGQVSYYTDQGDLSPVLPSAAANQFVADAFSTWTTVPTAALTATRAGALDEDVNGTNVRLIQGTLSLPDDLNANSGKPLAIVYDSDGRVFDALLGSGAGTPEMCETNSVYVVIDRIGDDAHIQHAMVFLNGRCAQFESDLPVLKYKLVRALGQVLGLDYSQLNENVITGSPGPSLDDYAGFPLMHPLAALCNSFFCQADAALPRMDDRAALSQLYPVTAANQIAGKQIFRDSTGRIYGTVRFPAWKGTLGQGMQGVNVVARLLDPVTSRISHRYTSSSVSGFRFRGRAGNPITGFYDVLGRRLDSFGSDDRALEGFYDLAGLEVPSGYNTATYEISLEAVNPTYVDSTSVGPYKQGQVLPSGLFDSVRVTVARGGEVEQDIAMQKAATEAEDKLEPHSFLFPAAVPDAGSWSGTISGYGDLDFFYFSARANRSFTFDVTALTETSAPTAQKLQPVLGAWTGSDTEDSPRVFESYFNSGRTGTTRLQATTLSAREYKIGVADARGDGRPDYRYEARLLYADDVAPSRASVRGGTAIIVTGIGFSNNMQVTVGATPVPASTLSPNQLRFSSPALPDGMYSIEVRDPGTGAVAQMEHVLRIGGADAKLVLLSGSNPQVPVGTQAPNPLRVQVVDSDTGEPIAGATVNLSVPDSAAISGCSQASCAFVSDQNGCVTAFIVVKAEGPSQIVATLLNGSLVAASVNGIAAALEITVTNPSVNVIKGASITVPVVATVVANGLPVANRTVNFLLNIGDATIAPGTAITDSNGNAASTVTVEAIALDVNISACVAPDNAPCRTVVIHSVDPSNLVLQEVSGAEQTISVGHSFTPIALRVVDAMGNSVAGVPVNLMIDVYRPPSDTVRVQRGEVIITTRDEPVVLASWIDNAVSDNDGLAVLNLNLVENEPVRVLVRAVAGGSELSFSLQSVWAQSLSTSPGSARPRTSLRQWQLSPF